MGFMEQVVLAQREGFRAKVRMAAVTAAIQIAGEAQGSLTVVAYDKRQQLAQRVLRTAGGGERSEVVDMFVWAVAQDQTMVVGSSDVDILAMVNAVWSDCAGVSVLD